MSIPNACLTADLVIHTAVGGYRRSRLYYTLSSAPATVHELTRCCNALSVKFAPLLTPLLPTSHQFLGVEGRYKAAGVDLESNSTNGPFEGDVSAGGEEEGTSDGLPDEAAIIIKRITGKGGRSKRGRLFIGGLSESINNNGVIATSAIDVCKDLMNAVPEDVVFSINEETESTMHARHWDRKNSVLEPVVSAALCLTIGSRIDRRQPLELVYLAQVPPEL